MHKLTNFAMSILKNNTLLKNILFCPLLTNDNAINKNTKLCYNVTVNYLFNIAITTMENVS